MKNSKIVFTVLLAAVVGFVLVLQIKSFDKIDVLLRDQQSNIFQEIKILKDKNEALTQEVSLLEDNVLKLNDQSSAILAVEEEITKYKKLSGSVPIYGTGLGLSVGAEISTFWMIDLVNEIFSAGAQAVAVNGIRLTNRTVGFDTLPQGQILLNGSILSPPYQIEVIGESNVLMSILTIRGGILDRLRARFPNLRLEIVAKEIVQMN